MTASARVESKMEAQTLRRLFVSNFEVGFRLLGSVAGVDDCLAVELRNRRTGSGFQ